MKVVTNRGQRFVAPSGKEQKQMRMLIEGFLLEYKHAHTWKQNTVNEKQQKQ